MVKTVRGRAFKPLRMQWGSDASPRLVLAELLDAGGNSFVCSIRIEDVEGGAEAVLAALPEPLRKPPKADVVERPVYTMPSIVTERQKKRKAAETVSALRSVEQYTVRTEDLDL